MILNELLIDIKETYDLSTSEMCLLYAKDGKPIRDTNMSAWLSGKKVPPEGIANDTPQIEERVLWLSAYLMAHPELDEFSYAHFKAAINNLALDSTN